MITNRYHIYRRLTLLDFADNIVLSPVTLSDDIERSDDNVTLSLSLDIDIEISW